MTKDIEVRATSSAIASQDELSIEQLTEQVAKIQGAMKAVMKDGEHYGVIPGTNKPTLLKPGAEKLCLLFRLAPTYRREITWHDDGHMTVVATCSLKHISTESLIAEGDGMCSTRESKYAYRHAARVCPKCGAEAIVKQKAEKGGNWICVGNDKGGCWARFDKADVAITGQEIGRKDNPDLSDQYNTVLKMACKRALVAAVLNGTAASDIFTQDVEDAAVVEPAQPVEGDVSGREAETRAPAPGTPSPSASEGGAPAAETQSPEPATSSGPPSDEELNEKDRLVDLVERAIDEHATTLPNVIKASMGYCARANCTPPASKSGIGKLPLSVLQGIVKETGIDQTLGAAVS